MEIPTRSNALWEVQGIISSEAIFKGWLDTVKEDTMIFPQNIASNGIFCTGGHMLHVSDIT